MNISYTQCGAKNRVTIIQRHQRKILNLHELMEASRSAGYINTHTVTFEEMKLVDQMRAAYCTDVLVGIQGGCTDVLVGIQGGVLVGIQDECIASAIII